MYSARSPLPPPGQVRALRPLRALKRVPGMPKLISSILAAMPALANVAALTGFIFLVFGIVGMELFKGSLHYRCLVPDEDGDYDEGASGLGRRRLKGGGGGDQDIFCAADPTVCDDPSLPLGTTCAYFDDNPASCAMNLHSSPTLITYSSLRHEPTLITYHHCLPSRFEHTLPCCARRATR